MATKVDEICEIECLNLDDLDVEELERRLEMSVAPHLEECPGDGGGCSSFCSTNVCAADCGSLCAAHCDLCGCNSACGVDIW